MLINRAHIFWLTVLLCCCIGFGVLGGEIFGGAHELNGESMESSVFSSLSLSSNGSHKIQGNKPTFPEDLTIPISLS